MERKEVKMKMRIRKIYHEAKKYPHPYCFVNCNNNELKNPILVNISKYQDLIQLIEDVGQNRVTYKITSKNKFIFINTGN